MSGKGKDGVWQMRGLEGWRVCVCVEASSRAQVATENINRCHGLGGQHGEGHLEPRGSGVGMASHTVDVCECHPAGHWAQGGRVSAATPLASSCSKRHMPACHRTVSACARLRLGPWLPPM